MKVQIEWVLNFISNPQTNINDGCTLLAYLSKEFFNKHNFIAATVV